MFPTLYLVHEDCISFHVDNEQLAWSLRHPARRTNNSCALKLDALLVMLVNNESLTRLYYCDLQFHNNLVLALNNMRLENYMTILGN